MKKEDIDILDWKRILLGEVPPGFFLEVTLRTAIIYAILIISMRLMGKRMASQLARNEMVAMISLAAAIGIPLQSPERGLIAAVIIAFIVIVVQQSVAKWAAKNEKFEAITQDKISTLVENGCLKIDDMTRTRLTRERVFGQLRNAGIKQLGEVRRMYLEANGTFTILKYKNPVEGLTVVPDWDAEFMTRYLTSTEKKVCGHCGNNIKMDENGDRKCAGCGSGNEVNAVINKPTTSHA